MAFCYRPKLTIIVNTVLLINNLVNIFIISMCVCVCAFQRHAILYLFFRETCNWVWNVQPNLHCVIELPKGLQQNLSVCLWVRGSWNQSNVMYLSIIIEMFCFQNFTFIQRLSLYNYIHWAEIREVSVLTYAY